MLRKPEDVKDHHCHANGCKVATSPEMLMCLRHWRMVPKKIQKFVWATYRNGQCYDTSMVTPAWLIAADMAIIHVAHKENLLTEDQFTRALSRQVNKAVEQGIELP